MKSVQVNKERKENGQGIFWRSDRNIYIMGYKNGAVTEEKEYISEWDGTHTLFHVKKEQRGLVLNIFKKEISRGHIMR